MSCDDCRGANAARYRAINTRTQRIRMSVPVLSGGETTRKADTLVQTKVSLGSSLDRKATGDGAPDQVIDGDLWRALMKQKIPRGLVTSGTVNVYALG